MTYLLDDSLLALVTANYALKIPHSVAAIKDQLEHSLATCRGRHEFYIAYGRALMSAAICMAPTIHYAILLNG